MHLLTSNRQVAFQTKMVTKSHALPFSLEAIELLIVAAWKPAFVTVKVAEGELHRGEKQNSRVAA